jgi:hypothetical protein
VRTLEPSPPLAAADRLTSATSYTMAVPSTEETSAAFNPYVLSSQRTRFEVAPRKASSMLPAMLLAIRKSAFSILGLGGASLACTSTVNSMSNDVSRALPVSSPAPGAAWPSPHEQPRPRYVTRALNRIRFRRSTDGKMPPAALFVRRVRWRAAPNCGVSHRNLPGSNRESESSSIAFQ